MIVLVLSHDDGELVLTVALIENIFASFVGSHHNILPFHCVELFLFVHGNEHIVKGRRKPKFRILLVDVRDGLLSSMIVIEEIFHVRVGPVKIIFKNVVLKFIVELSLDRGQNVFVFNMAGLQKAKNFIIAGYDLLSVRLRVKLKFVG